MGNSTLAVIVSNRDFFPSQLVAEARRDVLGLLAEMGVEAVVTPEDATPNGAIETWEDAKKCAALFSAERHRIDGVLVVLPNFGNEKAVSDAIQLSGLDVPILVQAYPDDPDRLQMGGRRDAFCGKISLCNNLRQRSYAFSLTELHTVAPRSREFRSDLDRFLAVCRVVKGLRRARLGAIGARPDAFNTVRFSEKLLQAAGISVSTVDLSEILGAAAKLADTDPAVKAQLESIKSYLPYRGVPDSALLKMAKLGVVVDDWVAANDLDATAIQCWNSIQANYGVNACTIMSMMSERLMPSACEVDVTGVAAMYALQLASGRPSALADWNNNYAGDPDKCVLFHCGNWPRSFFADPEMQYAHVLATTLGQENTYGAISGRVAPSPATFARISTDDARGLIRAYVAEGSFTDDPLDTIGARAVVEVPGLQRLLKHVCREGFEHHVAMSASRSADVVAEALGDYLKWEVYRHS